MNKNGRTDWPSLVPGTQYLVERLIEEQKSLRIKVQKGELGETLIDCGTTVLGGLEAGRRIVEICLANLGTVTVQCCEPRTPYPFSITVHTSNPVLSCLASQYAGWSLSADIDGDTYNVLGSGPGRAQGSSEPMFDELSYRDQGDSACLVLEAEKPPPKQLIQNVAQACNLSPDQLTFVYAPTTSLAGSVQVVGRVLEVALHKTHQLKFPLDRIVDGVGSAPLVPPAPEFISAMGRTNDAIIFGGRVQLYVTGPSDDAKELAEKLPSSTSSDYGTPFAEIFKKVKGNFYDIDPMLFSPAMVTITNLDSGESFHAGRIDDIALRKSFFG